MDQGTELSEREPRGPAHVRVIVAILWFLCGIGVPRGSHNDQQLTSRLKCEHFQILNHEPLKSYEHFLIHITYFEIHEYF